MHTRVAALSAVLLACVLAPASVSAHPHELGELYVPWTDKLSEQQWLMSEPATAPSPNRGGKPPGGGAGNLQLVGNADKDGTVNSDLAFWGDLAYAGNYDGFRIIDVSSAQPVVVTDFRCRGPQNDVSVHEMGGKRFLFQSIDSGQTAENCASADAPVLNGGRVGYEGVRVFDVTNPRAPVFLDMIQTACGSHTHTLVPDGDKAYLYVSSYPLGTGVTEATGPGAFRRCAAPHKKLSIKIGRAHV